MKQSFSITTATHQKLHLISYYARSHPSSQTLIQPSQDQNLKHIRPVKGMYPESTVHEQQSIPVVIRGPMVPQHSPNPAYARQQGATHPASYAAQPGYGWAPSPVTPPVMQQYALNSAPMPLQHRSTSNVGSIMNSQPLFNPPSPYQQPTQQNGGSPRFSDRLPLPLDGMVSQPPLHRGSMGSPMMGLQNRSPRSPQSQVQRSTPPRSLPPPNLPHNQGPYVPDERYSSPANSVPSRTPPRGSPRWEVTPLKESPKDLESNRLNLEVQDIPSEKFLYHEDSRLIKVLDRAFAA